MANEANYVTINCLYLERLVSKTAYDIQNKPPGFEESVRG